MLKRIDLNKEISLRPFISSTEYKNRERSLISEKSINNEILFSNSLEEVFNTFVKFKEAIDVEVSAREENDRMTLNQLSIEKEESKSTDEDLKKHIITSREELASSISLEKDANNNLKY